jgi:hypothetical protein
VDAEGWRCSVDAELTPLVEIADLDGKALDVIQVPADVLEQHR